MPSSNPSLHRTPLKIAIAMAFWGASLTLAPTFAADQSSPAAGQAASAVVLPGDNFYDYANGSWMQETEIPADRSSWGSFASLSESGNQRLLKLIAAIPANRTASAEAKQVSAYYQAYMDEAGIEAKGLAPLKPLLKSIDGLRDKTALAHALGTSLRADVDPLNDTRFFTENLFGLWIAQNLNETSHNVPYLLQGGLGMPDRAYYLTDSPRMAGLRTQYQAYIASMLKLAGGDADAEARAARVFELERNIAEVHASREDSADVAKGNNQWRSSDFASKAPGLDWNAFFASAGLAGQRDFIVWHPGAFTGTAALVAATPLSTWKDFLSFHTINHFATTLPKAVSEQRFAFYGRALSGTPQQSARWKRGLASTNAALSDAVGKLYVEQYFPPESKVRVQHMVSNIVAAFSRRIDRLDWMAPATKAQAQEKLKTLYVGVAYPDHWKSYDGLKIGRHDALGNALRAEQFHYRQELAKLGKPVDRSEWAMPAQLVNAVNLPLQNALNFPAAILQAPFFDPNASDAANYGGIGATIGHEISHSFDDQGAQFDAQGRWRDWWSEADLAHFKAAAGTLAAQYSTYQPFPDLAVNGQLTLSENLADLAGLAVSYDAFKASQQGKPVQADADRQFFLGFAHTWRNKAREAAVRQQILTDGHAPAAYRSATVRNLDAWYQAFGVQPGQQLYLAPEQRVRVW
ncbi:M13 family metallopeptidase [Janthinobacterium agaricidamnosum]|uniref:Peptidase M13 family protein n=1 Tax=Janthinobacterium agaricidamnosum NBRC 102515 = DSM 9628 TaxID=1349767 RepID=W0V7B9_9BURK|nr:M13 family metallopeptidase [Janthinobacterium agaricidamnosum]CDG84734.1 peptidase M13 family protein [Janthinobacterium agaricidamnosum NBRC 102515 = DSM 9628]